MKSRLKFELSTLFSRVVRGSMGKDLIWLPVLTQYPTKIGQGSMVKEGKAAEETATTLVADDVSVSQLSAMNPGELFRLAAELGLSIEPMPSPPTQDLRLVRYIE